MYSVTLYCSDPACDAVFEAEGTLDGMTGAICPFCGCTLGELTCAPVECPAEEEGGSQPEELELWLVHGPVGRRLRRRRRRADGPLRRAA
jgi:hypothetical protein